MVGDSETSSFYPGLGAPPGAGDIPIYLMSEETLQKWTALPSDRAIGPGLTKSDLDNLYFSISNTIVALDSTNKAFINWSNGKVIEAQQGLEISRQNVANGMNCLRHFFEALISREVERSSNG